MLVIRSYHRLLWAIAALSVPNIGHSETAHIEIESTNLHSIEINYSINTGKQELCYLALPAGNGTVVPSPSISYRVFSGMRIDEVSPLAEYAQYLLPADEEKLSVFSLPNNQKITGTIVIYDEGSMPSETEFTMQLVVRGFECDAISAAERERGFAFDKVDTRTSAPSSVPEDNLVAVYSDEFHINFDRR